MEEMDTKVEQETPAEESQPRQENFEDRLDLHIKRRHSGSWVGAFILIFVGVIFLLKELGMLFDNWWALFFLIPAIASFGSAWNHYHRHRNQITSSVLGSLIVGLVMIFLTVIFLFSLNWSYMWPIFLIIIGVMIFINSFLK